VTAARNLALEALRQLDRSLEFADWENGDGEEIGPVLREAVAALLAETGEPVAVGIVCNKESAKFLAYESMPKLNGWVEVFTAPPPAVPQGWKLVPIEPTPEMCAAGDDCQDADPRMDDSPSYYGYKAMIAAAPGAPA